MKRDEILSLAWETAGNPEFWDDDDIVEFAETVARRAALAETECCCGEPTAGGIVHRQDGPCYMAEPEGGLYLTIVYCDIQPGPETSALTRHPKVSAVSWSHAIDDRNAARAALADKEVGQEPVAWRFQSAVGGWAYGSQPPVGSKYPVYPLYASPSRREWQTLTEAERTRLYKDWMDNETTDSYDLMNSVEAALREKNHVRD